MVTINREDLSPSRLPVEAPNYSQHKTHSPGGKSGTFFHTPPPPPPKSGFNCPCQVLTKSPGEAEPGKPALSADHDGDRQEKRRRRQHPGAQKTPRDSAEEKETPAGGKLGSGADAKHGAGRDGHGGGLSQLGAGERRRDTDCAGSVLGHQQGRPRFRVAAARPERGSTPVGHRFLLHLQHLDWLVGPDAGLLGMAAVALVGAAVPCLRHAADRLRDGARLLPLEGDHQTDPHQKGVSRV